MTTKRRPVFKSVFTKYMTSVSVLVLLCILLIGTVQSVVSLRYWISEKETVLTEDAHMLASSIADRVERNANGDGYVLRMDGDGVVPVMVQLISKTSGVDLIVTNTTGAILISSPGGDDTLVTGDTVPNTVMQQIDEADGTYFSVGTLGNLFLRRQYVAASKINHHGVTVGYVFVLASADSLMEYLGNQLRMYALAALVSLVLVLIGTYLVTGHMVRPLREMAAATRRFGEGDFSPRLEVKGADEVAQLAHSLNEMAVSLSSVEGMSRSFVANVSHELKTPMTTISGFIDGILDGTIPPDKQKHYLTIVSDEVRRLSRLVNAMLNLSRIDNGTLAFRPVPFDFAELVCKTALSFEQRVDSKKVEIVGLEACCDPCPMVGDFDLLGQVVYNLLDNAVKFVNEGGTIAMAIHHDAEKTQFVIRNTGAGVSPEELPHLFERFYKSDKSRSIDKTGVGLGLYIVHHVIHLHGGEITVQSVEGSYTEFSFWLPNGTPLDA